MVGVDVLSQVSSLRNDSVIPKEEDLHGAAIALVRLQDTYLLNVTDLAEGHFYGVEDSKNHGGLIVFFNLLVLLSIYVSRTKNYRTIIETTKSCK